MVFDLQPCIESTGIVEPSCFGALCGVLHNAKGWHNPRDAQDQEKLEADVTIGYKLGTGGCRNPVAGCISTMSMNEGKALLGTPHRGGVTWFLVNHRGAITRTIKIAKAILSTTGGGPGNSDENGKPWYNVIWHLT